jgi:hypothetical protein
LNESPAHFSPWFLDFLPTRHETSVTKHTYQVELIATPVGVRLHRCSLCAVSSYRKGAK